MSDYDLFGGDEAAETPRATSIPVNGKSLFETGTAVAPEPTPISSLGAPVTGFWRGAAELAGMPVDATAWLLRKAGLDSGKAPIGGSESLKNLGSAYMRSVGATPIEPRSRGEKLAESFGKGVAGAALPAVAAETMLPKLAGLYPRTTSVLKEMLGPSGAGVRPMAELSAIGGAGGVGADVAIDMVPDKWKPTAGLAGGMVGGGLGALGVAASRAVPSMASAVKGYVEPMTKAGVENIAAKQLAAASGSSANVLDRIENQPHEIIAGSLPTTFELTGDMGLGQAQRKAETMFPAKFLERKADQSVARTKELGTVAPTGDPVDVASFFRQRSQDLDKLAQQRIAQAEADARREIDKLGGRATPEIYGETLRKHLETAKKAMRQDRADLYAQVDPNTSVDVSALRTTADGIAKSRSSLAAELTPGENEVLEKAVQLPDQITFKDLQEFDSNITEKMALERRASGESTAWRRLSKMKSAVMDAIATTPESPALGAAKAKHAEYSQTYRQGSVADVLKTIGFNEQYRTSNASVMPKAFPPGAKGYEAALAFRKAVGNDQQAVGNMLDYVSSSLRREATDANGVLDPKKFAAWQSRHQDALRAFPELAGKFDGAQQAAESLSVTREAMRDMINNSNAKAFAKVSGLNSPEDVKKTIGSIFSSSNPVKQMSDLATETAFDINAYSGLRRAVAEHIRDQFISNAEAGTSGENLIKSDQFQTFLKKNAAALRKVFTNRELESMNKVAADLHRSNRSIRSTALPGRSTSAQDILPTIKEGGPTGWKMIAEAVAGAGGASVLTTSPVAGASAIGMALGHHIFDGMRQEGLRDANEMVVEALLNPKLAAQLLRKVPATKTPTGSLKQDLKRVPALGLINSRSGYARGGKIGGMTPDMLVKAAERSKKKIQSQSEHILDAPDEHVVSALNAAKQHI